MRSLTGQLARLTGLVAMVCALPAALSGQQQRTGEALPGRGVQERTSAMGVSDADLIERLRRSGMDRAQVRAGLDRLGQDPGLADRYFDAMEGRRPVPDGQAPRALIEAMTALGLPVVAHADQIGTPSPWVTDSDAVNATGRPVAGNDGPKLFGLDLFRRFTTQFDAPLSGPVDPAYRLGPGDELSLILTGEVEFSYALEVTREGFIVIPDVGQLFVSGVTLNELEDRLFGVLGRHYSGVRRGENAPIRFHVGLRRLRTSAVYVVGEAVRPGAYQVSSVATVFSALYVAGGPAEPASFRSIELRRSGRVVRTLDLYDYLLHGETTDDVRLEHGDVIFIPVSGRRVTIEGAVRRPAIFELRPDDGLVQAVAFAGGLSPAASHRIQIDRILPVEQRQPGVDRTLSDIDGAALASGQRVPLMDGDVVRVFEILSERRNRIVVAGEVHRPGVYEWTAGMTLGQLLVRADGLAERAYTWRTHIYRLNPRNGARHLLRLEATDFDVTPLMDRDSVVVFGVDQLANRRFVSIDGFVKNPGNYELPVGMTLQDLVLAAGGFVHGAWVVEAELARMSLHGDGGTHTVTKVRLGGRPDAQNPDVLEWRPDATEVTLEHGDHVFIRKAPEYDVIGTVKVTGEVVFPGAYALTERSIRISDVLARAGGLEPEAHIAGAQLVRNAQLVATDMGAALRKPGSPPDLELFPGDSLMVPRLDATVLVRGAVGFETRVRYEAGRNADYYVARAGGFAENADRGRTTVTQQNGARAVANRRRFFFDSVPQPGPGSTVFVPAGPEQRSVGVDWDALLTRVVGMASATATLLIAVDRIR